MRHIVNKSPGKKHRKFSMITAAGLSTCPQYAGEIIPSTKGDKLIFLAVSYSTVFHQSIAGSDLIESET